MNNLESQLQAALAFWMPGVNEETDTAFARSAGDDAYLLAGFNGKTPQPSWGEQMLTLSDAAKRWAAARRAFLSLPAGSTDARACLDALSEAESALAALCAPASPQ